MIINDEKIELNNTFIKIILMFVVTQSLSVLSAINISEFLKIYKNIILGVIFFFISNHAISNKKRLRFLLVSIVLLISMNLIYRVIIFFKPEFLYQIFTAVIYDKFIYFLNIQANRSRFFVEYFDWAEIPLIIFLFYKEKNFVNKSLLIAITFFLIYFSILSGYRALFLVSLIGFLMSFFILRSKRYFFILLIILFTVIFFGQQMLIRKLITSPIDRLIDILSNDISTINSRLIFWQEAWNMGLTSPIFGIGLGNFYDNLPNKKIIIPSLFDWKNELMRVTVIHPHNVFFASLAETGFFGLFSLLTLIIYFFISDLNNFKTGNFAQSLISSFWLLFSLSLVEPNFILQYQITFWLLRAMIYKSRKILF